MGSLGCESVVRLPVSSCIVRHSMIQLGAIQREWLDICLPYFNIESICRLGLSSTAARQLCSSLLQENKYAARQALLQAVEDSSWLARSARQRFEVLLKQLQWLICEAALMEGEQAGIAVLGTSSGLAAELLSTRSVAAPVAALMLAKGMNFSYQQLLSAAKAGVPGIEVWVQACRQQGLEAIFGIPPIAVDLCCNKQIAEQDQDLHQLSPQLVMELMQLAAVMWDSNATANMAALCELPAAKALGGSTLAELISVAKKFDHVAHVSLLLKLPAAAELPAADILKLLQMACIKRLADMVCTLRFLPAASQISQAEMLGLTKWAMRVPDPTAADIMSALCSLPAMQQVQVADLKQLMLAQAGVPAWLDPRASHVRILSQMPAAALLSTADVVDIVSAHLSGQMHEFHRAQQVEVLCGLAAAQRLGALQVMGLMTAALKQNCKAGHRAVVRHLSALPGAQQLDSASVQQLLTTCLQNPVSKRAFGRLCSLSAAQQLGPQQVADLLAGAVQQREAAAVKHLCSLPGSQRIDRNSVWNLFQTGYSAKALGVLDPLCGLPGAQQLDDAQWSVLLDAAVGLGDTSLVQGICAMTGTQGVNGA